MSRFFKLLSALLCSFSVFFSIISCDFGAKNNTTAESRIDLKAPVISPMSGDYPEGFKIVSITSENEKGDIYYTTNGNIPTINDIRYVGEFTVIGSRTIKAIVIYNDSKSPVTTSELNLNVGKTQSQMGSIHGTVKLDSILSAVVKASLSDSTIYIFSEDLPGVVKSCKVGDEYYFDGLDTTRSYRFYFTNEQPGSILGSKGGRAAGTQTSTNKDGEFVVGTEITVIPGEGIGVEVPVDLKATGTIKGTVKRYDVKGDLEPDQGGTSVYVPGTSFSAFTDRDGNFEISGLPQSIYTIRAQYAGYSFVEKENIELKATSEDAPETVIEDSFELAFARGIVKGNVVYSDSTDPDANGGITVIIKDPSTGYTYNSVSASDGYYALTDVYPGTYTAELSAPGYERAIITDITVIGAKVNVIPTTSLQVIGGSLRGSVTVAEKTDLSGITVLAENTDSGKSFFAVTNSKGEFGWEKVSPGTYIITASYAGYKSVSVSGIIITMGSAVEGITLPQMERSTYSVSGKVLLEGAESGFEGTSILLKNIRTLASFSTVSGVDGTYSISDVEPGEYQLTFSKTGYLTDNSVTINVGASSVCNVNDVMLKNASGSVNGNVTLENTTDYAGINILVISEKDSSMTFSTITDSYGHYSLGGIIPGEYKVQATKAGYVNGYTDSFTVSAGQVVTANTLSLSISQRSIYGKVILEGRVDFVGIKITATNISNPSEIYSALTNSSGMFAISGMNPGEYVLSYSFENYVSYTSSSMNLENNSSLEADTVELKRATGKIAGIVNLEGCTDHSGVTVSLVGTDRTCVTEYDGSYEFSVPSGNYPGGVRFYKEDYQLTAKAKTITVLTDSTFGVMTVEMKATANTLKGRIDLAGSTDDSGISVSIDEYPELESVITDNDGNWILNHVPVDVENYITVRFTRENTPDMTTQVKVIANDYIVIPTLEMIPNASTLKGHAYLTDMTDHQNIIVTVKTGGKDDIVTRTTSDGAFEVNNILSTGSHEIIFSKDGWESQSITIDDFEPLEERVMTNTISLIDTAAPIFDSVVIGGGANFTNSTQLGIRIIASDTGSGISKMAVQIQGPNHEGLYPSVLDWQDYAVQFTKELAVLPRQIFTGNGEYGIYITLKDNAGNVTETLHDEITVTDQVHVLKGVLTGNDLNLTKESSPYRVAGNCLVSDKDILVIEPGVQIEFDGYYYFRVDGAIEAIGTETDYIVFTKSPDYSGTQYNYTVSETSVDDLGFPIEEYCDYQTIIYWDKLILNGNSNNFEYCKIEYSTNLFSSGANLNMNNCILDMRLGIDICGNISNSIIIKDNKILNNEYCSFVSGDFYLNTDATTRVLGDVCNTNICKNWSISGNVISCDITDGNVSANSVINCTITNADHIYSRNITNSRIYNTSIDADVICYCDINNSNLSSTVIQNNNLTECSIRTAYNWFDRNLYRINNNNIRSCIIHCDVHDYNQILDFSNNYWGIAGTEELVLSGTNSNISFIYDFYDDFELAKVDFSNWAISEIEEAGYKGDSFDWSTINIE